MKILVHIFTRMFTKRRAREGIGSCAVHHTVHKMALWNMQYTKPLNNLKKVV